MHKTKPNEIKACFRLLLQHPAKKQIRLFYSIQGQYGATHVTRLSLSPRQTSHKFVYLVIFTKFIYTFYRCHWPIKQQQKMSQSGVIIGVIAMYIFS